MKYKSSKYFIPNLWETHKPSTTIHFEEIHLPFTLTLQCICGKTNRVKAEKKGIYKCGHCSEVIATVY